jgi:hypothetical protein
MPAISVANTKRWKRVSLGSLTAAVTGLLLGGGMPLPIPSAFRFELDAQPELHRLWEASAQAKAERVACLAATIDSDTVHISRVLSLDPGPADSLGISAGASLEQCGPPEWRGTVHTHVALRDGQRPYSLFSGPGGAVLFPRSRY